MMPFSGKSNITETAQMFTEERRADPECQLRQRGKDHIWGLALRSEAGKAEGRVSRQ